MSSFENIAKIFPFTVRKRFPYSSASLIKKIKTDKI